MTSILNQILRWLHQPKIWRFVCFASSVVGLLCYGLSSSFNHLFGKWNWLKIFLYSVFSFIICLAILFARTQQSPTSLRVKAHLVFSVFTMTTVYSFFFDKVNGKPDAYSLISCAAFAIMSLTLSKQTHCGFEIDLLYFFCGYLTLQLMKIKLFLVIVGAGFSYSLIILRFYLGAPTESGHLGYQVQDQHFVAIPMDSNAEETNTGGAIQLGSPQANTATGNAHLITPHEANSDSAPIRTFVALPENGDVGLQNLMVTRLDSHSQQGNSDIDRIRLDNHIKEFANMNWKLNSVIWEQVEKYQEASAYSQKQNKIWAHISEILGKEEIINNLQETAKHMVAAGFGIQCRNAYNVFRSKFVNKCLCRFGLQEVNLRDVEKENIESLIVAFNVALRILLPIERRLWRRMFSGFSPEYNIFSTSDWRRMEIELWAKFIVLETRICSGIRSVLGSGVDRITRDVMKCLKDVCEDRDNTAYFNIPAVIQLLERNLDAKSKNYKIPALGYLFRVHNGRYIQLMAKEDPLRTLLGEDWIRKQTSKIKRNIKHCLTCSWNKVLDLLKLESNESAAPDVAAKSMKDKLHLFNLHFEEICSDQSTWFVPGDWIRREMRRSLEMMLLPVYENFLGRFRDVVGSHADQFIKYGTSDIQDQLSRLFPQNELLSGWSYFEKTEKLVRRWSCFEKIENPAFTAAEFLCIAAHLGR